MLKIIKILGQKALIDTNLQHGGSRYQTRPTWCPPRQGRFKVNVDGAVFESLKSCGIGVVIRNEASQIMGAMSRFLPLPLGALEVEAKAMD